MGVFAVGKKTETKSSQTKKPAKSENNFKIQSKKPNEKRVFYEESASSGNTPEQKTDFRIDTTFERKWVPQPLETVEKLSPQKQNAFRSKASRQVRALFRACGSRVKVDFGDEFSREKLDCRLVNNYVAGLEDILHRFPFLAKAVQGFSVERMGGPKGSFLGGYITFASDQKYPDIVSGIAAEKIAGTKSTNHVNHTVYHEMGHVFFHFWEDNAESNIEAKACLVFIEDQLETLQFAEFTGDILSTYAVINPSEMFAECFAEYCATTQPRTFAKQIIEKILQIINSIGDR